jgi:alpha-N-arabinofuranosidase
MIRPASRLFVTRARSLAGSLAAALFGLSLITASSASNYSASVSIDLARPLGAISPHIYGQYLEHVQREDECIYPSLWADTSPFADAFGLRRDVMAAARELGVPVVRWPGGCFADVYHWRDGIGPQSQRPVRVNQHWGGEEPNHFGTDEFLRWCREVGSAAYINANLGTGTVEECLAWLDYCNATNRRVQFWGIGNETFGEWEAGHMDAPTYARTLAQWAAAVRRADPQVQILGVGSMSANNPRWDSLVLRRAGNLIDLLTIHAYGYSTGAPDEFLAVAFTPVYFEHRLRKMLRVVDEFAGQRTNATPIRLALDEWNIRHYRDGQLNRRSPRTLQDAVFAAGVLNTMIRLSPRVAMANYVFLVNGNGVMLVNREQIVRTPVFHVFQQYGQWMRGDALAVDVVCPTTTVPPPQAHTPKHKPPADFRLVAQPWLDVAAARQADGTIAVSLLNRHPHAAARTALELPEGVSPARVWTLSAPDVFAANTFAQPDRVRPELREFSDKVWTCPPHSVSLILCQPAPARTNKSSP